MPNDIRILSATELSAQIIEARQTSHTLLHCFCAALGNQQLAVPFKENLNPPLWEFGHVAWFADYWIARNPGRSLGTRYQPLTHLPSALQAADGLFNSATVAHETRWQLPLLGIDGIEQYLKDVAARTDHCLASDMAALEMPKRSGAGHSVIDDTNYFYRLALAHEDMHAEAFYMTAQDLGFPMPGTDSPPWQSVATESQSQLARVGAAPPEALGFMRAEAAARSQIFVPKQTVVLPRPASGFFFDNEAESLSESLDDFEIDTQPVDHAAYAAFMEDQGYQRPELWSSEGWAWRWREGLNGPRYLSLSNGRLVRQWFGQTFEVPGWFPMIHISLYEAQAWARWAGRQLPTEAQWMAAALSAPELFVWGDVWEWTASRFLPFDGFAPHPYKEYSAPWFGDHQVLKGASWVTNNRLRNLRFRNFYKPHRADVFAGFRTVGSYVAS
ncbi:MAG: SUMF1/EgtB/PvdO family nonheme iron enzyme [Burkholderiaceae bacterium]